LVAVNQQSDLAISDILASSIFPSNSDELSNLAPMIISSSEAIIFPVAVSVPLETSLTNTSAFPVPASYFATIYCQAPVETGEFDVAINTSNIPVEVSAMNTTSS